MHVLPLLIIQQAQPVCSSEGVSGRNNILKTLTGTSGEQQKETLLMTYNAVGRLIINYASPVCSPNLHDTNYRKIQYTQNKALRIATGYHKMSRMDHLHTEAEMLKVREHSDLLSAQYLSRTRKCMSPHHNKGYPWETDERDTIYQTSKHCRANDGKNDRKATLQALHTDAVDKAVKSHDRNVVLDGPPPSISSSEKRINQKGMFNPCSTKIRIL